MDRPLVLVGLPGSGKSTVGPLVAEALGVPFVDLDRVIEAEAGGSVARILEEEGESVFRAMEARLGAGLVAGPPCVLAPGGGFFVDADLRRRTLASALVVYLATSPSEAARRLGTSQDRPLLRGYVPALRLRFLLEQREPVYREAQQRVTTDGRTPAEVAAEVVELARGVGVR